MKIVITFILVFLSTASYCQTDTIQRNAIFKTYDEFLHNTPSIKEPNVFLYKPSLKHSELKYTDSAGLLYTYSQPFWGYSDSENVYMKYKGAYALFIEIGKICVCRYFIVLEEDRGPVSNLLYRKNIEERALNSTNRIEKTFVLIKETGDLIELK